MAKAEANGESNEAIAFTRYIGIAVRPRSFGFVIVEDGSVLDSGVRMCARSEFDNCLGQRFVRILQTYCPSVAIICTPSRTAGERRRVIAATIKNHAKRLGTEVACIRPAAISRYFRRHNASTRYEIAQVVARILPELAWKLPPKRKPWLPEHDRMAIFDGAAAVIAHTIREKPSLS
jgi:hypothetical protein